MGKDFAETFPVARQVFDTANRVLGFDLSEICFNGPDERLNQTDISQPAIYVTSVAAFAVAREVGCIHPETVTAYAGLSLGEYTALHLGGAFSFEDGLKLVAARGKAMQEAAVGTPSGMVAVIGADEAAIEKLCSQSKQGDVLVPANFNAPGQIVVSGAKAACERFTVAAGAAGFKAVPLVVAGAFHSPIMQPGAEKMKTELSVARISPPRTTVYSNVTASPHTDSNSIARLLVDQIVKPVRWEQTMRHLVGAGDARWVELAPGRVLTGLLKKVNRRIAVENYATTESLNPSS
jgi:[acyl-carrier-protein] S-malonyltransferase